MSTPCTITVIVNHTNEVVSFYAYDNGTPDKIVPLLVDITLKSHNLYEIIGRLAVKFYPRRDITDYSYLISGTENNTSISIIAPRFSAAIKEISPISVLLEIDFVEGRNIPDFQVRVKTDSLENVFRKIIHFSKNIRDTRAMKSNIISALLEEDFSKKRRTLYF